MPRPKKIRPPHKGQVSDSGLWSLSVGDRPYKVTVREDRKPGARIIFDYHDHGGRRQPAAGLESVRGADEQFDRDLIERAEELALDRSAELRLNRLREEVQPQTLTMRQAFDLYFHPERGGLAQSKSSRNAGRASRKDWLRHLGADTPWNRVLPRDVDALARRHKNAGRVKTAEQRVKWLRTVYNWLKQKARVRGLEDPTEFFDFQKLMEGYEPNRPMYSDEETEKLIGVAFQVDPRYRLFMAMMDDSVVRRAAVIKTMRSAINHPMNVEPSKEDAPNGWIIFPPLKGQPPVPWPLTEFQRRELDMALTTHLSELERVYQEHGRDYPLFPGAKMYSAAREERRPISPTQVGAYRPCSDGLTEKWMRQAEELAGVPHIKGRLCHGLRRTSADTVYTEHGLSVLTTAGNWQNESTAAIYPGQKKFKNLAKAREAMEKKRKRRNEDPK